MAFAELFADLKQLLCFVLVFLGDCLTLTSVSNGYSLTVNTDNSRLSRLATLGAVGVGHAALSFKEGKRKHQGEKGSPESSCCELH